MLSSIASFLPSLTIASNKDLPIPTVDPDDPPSDDDDACLPPPQVGPGKPAKTTKEREGKGPTETFVFVRPPPSKSNHPLNLQVQLVPPNAKPPTGISDAASIPPASASSTTTEFGTSDAVPLRRTPSNQSQSSSSTFNNSSTTSFSSIASTSTSSSPRRTIIPLYNLQAHNMMPNVIIDAGTDAKIAKCQKRGIELIDLAFIEPVEVWGQRDARRKNGGTVARESTRLSVDGSGRLAATVGNLKLSVSVVAQDGALRSVSQSRPGSAIGDRTGNLSGAPSAVSLNSQPTYGGLETQSLQSSVSKSSLRSASAASITPTAPSLPTNVPPSPAPKKNIFGKLFNKKNAASPSSPSTTPTPHSKQTEVFPSFSSTFAILPSPKTPKAQQQQPENEQVGEDDMSTPTGAPPSNKERGNHSRNLGLKSTLKNRFAGPGNGSPATPLTGLGIIGDDKSRLNVDKTTKGRDPSPDPSLTKSTKSRVSWVGTATTQSSDSIETGQKDGNANATCQPFPVTISPPSVTEGTTNARQQQQQQLQLRPPVLGIQPTFVSSVIAPTTSGASPLVAVLSPKANSEKEAESLLKGQRALMYVWFVRRWLKKRPSIISSAVNEISNGVGGFFGKKKEPSSSQETAAGGEVASGSGMEVRFEWKRAKGKEARRAQGIRKRRRRTRAASGFSTIPGGGGESDGEAGRAREQLLKDDHRKKYRMSTGSLGVTASQENESGGNTEGGEGGEESGNESDPEDSETAWVCTLKIRRNAPPPSLTVAALESATATVLLSPTSPASGVSSSSFELSSSSQVLRVKVGTLSPAPHHPKVVAILKVPYPLPDVEVDRMAVVKRNGQGGVTVPSQQEGGDDDGDGDAKEPPYTGLKLTAEEIKDIVCSTGLWLVVREGFGGVGKVTRKGDGWRIRG